MRLTKSVLLWSALSIPMLLSSCNDDMPWNDVDGGEPEVTLGSERIMTESGREVHFVGKVTDNDGISTIKLRCPELKLNKTIDIIDIYQEPLKEYDLNYSFKIQENEVGDNFNVEVTITDIGGRTVTKKILVTMDGDFTAPVFTASPDKEMTVIIKPKTFFNLNFTVQDNRVVDYVIVDMEGVEGFPKRVEGNGKNIVEYAQKLQLPSVKAEYNVSIVAYDKPAQDGEVRSTEVKSLVKVDETPDFEKLWLCDVATAAELNSDVFGVPMLVDHVGPYQYSARYYNEKAGTKICFLAQKTDFSPVCYGPDDQYDGLLGDDPETVGRITLDKAGVYYKIDFNIKSGVYNLSTYSVADAINPVMFMHYGQDDLNTWDERNNLGDIWWQEWYFGPAGGPGDVTKMTQDSKNPNIFTIDSWRLEGGEEMNFILHNWHSHGWWNYTTWRVDNSSEPDKFMYYGTYIEETPHFKSNKNYFDYKYGNEPGFEVDKWKDEGYRKNYVPDNWCKPTVPATGNYKMIFDAHLERARLVPIK